MFKKSKWMVGAAALIALAACLVSCSDPEDEADDEIVYADCYGTWEGEWIIQEKTFPLTLICAESTFYYEGGGRKESLPHVSWSDGVSGRLVCSGAEEEGGDTKVEAEFYKADGSIVCEFSVSAMKGFAEPALLSRASDSTDVPLSE
ncbi:MAG: hypothetical protein K2H09_04100 [Treponemataceae bacterium]|nr:hypothetical protein [Treponemataceae bacterium]